jgi:hypothetical protein
MSQKTVLELYNPSPFRESTYDCGGGGEVRLT